MKLASTKYEMRSRARMQNRSKLRIAIKGKKTSHTNPAIYRSGEKWFPADHGIGGEQFKGTKMPLGPTLKSSPGSNTS
jgi:hypothetical protein